MPTSPLNRWHHCIHKGVACRAFGQEIAIFVAESHRSPKNSFKSRLQHRSIVQAHQKDPSWKRRPTAKQSDVKQQEIREISSVNTSATRAKPSLHSDTSSCHGISQQTRISFHDVVGLSVLCLRCSAPRIFG